MSESRRYLHDLRRALPRGQRRTVAAEIRSHLRDGIAAETAGGLDPAQAERIVIERLGPPERLAAQFPTTEDRLMKKPWIAGLAVAAVMVAVAALVGVTHTDHARPAATVTGSRTTAFASPIMKNGVVRSVWIGAAAKRTAAQIAVLQLNLHQVEVVQQQTWPKN